jgi:hypothetical protein
MLVPISMFVASIATADEFATKIRAAPTFDDPARASYVLIGPIAGIVGSDLMKFYRQYGFWRGMVAGLMENGTYVIPVPGNHEVQWKAGGKKAQAANEDAWRENMGDLILDDARFLGLFGEQASYENVGDNRVYDSLATDQSKLSYSFDFHGSHFAIINTDPVGRDAHAPVRPARSSQLPCASKPLDKFSEGGEPSWSMRAACARSG